jgi:hypothetical protein
MLSSDIAVTGVVGLKMLHRYRTRPFPRLIAACVANVQHFEHHHDGETVVYKRADLIHAAYHFTGTTHTVC